MYNEDECSESCIHLSLLQHLFERDADSSRELRDILHQGCRFVLEPNRDASARVVFILKVATLHRHGQEVVKTWASPESDLNGSVLYATRHQPALSGDSEPMEALALYPGLQLLVSRYDFQVERTVATSPIAVIITDSPGLVRL